MSDTLPRWGYVKGLGRVRVLEYLGDGRFIVLDKRDTRWVRRREQITFRSKE